MKTKLPLMSGAAMAVLTLAAAGPLAHRMHLAARPLAMW